MEDLESQIVYLLQCNPRMSIIETCRGINKRWEYYARVPIEIIITFSLFTTWLIMVALFVNIKLVILYLLMISSHEFGHYGLAKKYKVYEGLKICSWGFSIKLKREMPNRWAYLSGFIASLIIVPIAVFIIPLWFYLTLACGLSLFDFAVVIFYNRLRDKA